MVTAGIFPFKENSHGRAGNRTRDLMISSQRLWPLDHEAGRVYKICFLKILNWKGGLQPDGLPPPFGCSPAHKFSEVNFHIFLPRTNIFHGQVTQVTSSMNLWIAPLHRVQTYVPSHDSIPHNLSLGNSATDRCCVMAAAAMFVISHWQLIFPV